MTYIDTFENDLAALEQARVDRSRREWLQATTPPEVAARISRSFLLYDADPDVHLALAQAGVDPVADADVWAEVTAAQQVYRNSTAVGASGPAGALVNRPRRAIYEQRRGSSKVLAGFEGLSEEENRAVVEGLRYLDTSGVGTNGAQGVPTPTEDDYVRAVEQGVIEPTAFTEMLKLADSTGRAVGKVPDRPGVTDVTRLTNPLNAATAIADAVLPGSPVAGARSAATDAATNFAADNPVTDFAQAKILEPVGRFMRDNPVTTRAIAPTVNVGVSILDFPYQMTQASVRTAYETWSEDGFGGFFPEEFSIEGVGDFARDKVQDVAEMGLQTNLGALTLDVAEDVVPRRGPRTIDVNGRDVTFGSDPIIGEGVNIGSGFFFGGEAEEFRREMERSKGLIDGSSVTAGRWLFSSLDAGSKPHTILSGLVDASLALVGPGELAIDSVFANAVARRGFRTIEGGVPELRVGSALIDATDADEVVPLLRQLGIETFSDEDVARVVRAKTEATVEDALARMQTPAAPSVLDDAASALDAPPRRPSGVDLSQTIEQGTVEAIRARWGAIRGVRPTVDPNLVRRFLDSKRGKRLMETLADVDDTHDLDRVMRRALPAERLAEYADASTADEIRQLLEMDLGVRLAAKPGRSLRAPHAIDAVRDFSPRLARLAGAVPGGFYDLEDSRRLLSTVEDVLINEGASASTIKRWHNRLARTRTKQERLRVIFEMTDETALRAAVDGAPGDIGPKIRQWADDAGLDEDEMWAAVASGERRPTGVAEIDDEIAVLRAKTRKLGTVFRDHLEMGRVYNIDYLSGEPLDVLVNVNGDITKLDRAGVHLQAEAINRLVPVPDSREMRRYFSSMKGLLMKENGDLKWPALLHNFALGIQSKIWKPSVLLRLAWPIRVVGEEQLRLAAAGHPSLVRRPISHIAVMLGGNQGVLRRRLERLGFDIGSPNGPLAAKTSDLQGQLFTTLEEQTRAMSTGSGEARRIPKSKGFERIETAIEEPERVLEAWADEMAKLANDPVATLVLRSDDLDAAKVTFWENMDTVRANIRETRPNATMDVLTPEGASAYIDSVDARLAGLTNSNPDLLEAMRTRSLGDVPMGGGSGQVNEKFARALGAYQDSVPNFLPAREVLSSSRADRAFEFGDRTVRFLFSQLMAKPTDTLSRSPVFTQLYWDEVQALAPRLRRGDASKVIKMAEEANLPRREITQLRRTIGRDLGTVPSEAVGTLRFSEVETFAKAKGLQGTQDLLFDLSQRNQFFDIMSLLFPFGDAWAEVVTRWSKLIKDDPQVIRRASQTIEGGRETGIIYENENGEEVFNYPLSGYVNEFGALNWVPGSTGYGGIGVNIPFTGRLQGLSLATEILPGIGPVLQLPLAAALPDSRNWDWAREILFPFGEPDVANNPIQTVTDQFVPPAWRKVFTGLFGDAATPEEQRRFASDFMRVFTKMGASGEYALFDDAPGSTQSRDELARLYEDAQEGVGKLWTNRGIFQLAAPSAPAPEWFLDGDTGEKVLFSTLRELYGRSFEENPEDPIGEFVDRYGVWALAAVQGRTINVGPGRGLPPTREAEEWARQNQDFADRYGNVYGFFAPQGGDFDFNAYGRILDRGERVPLTEEQQVSRFLNSLGTIAYSDERERVVALAAERGWTGGNLPVEARRYLAEFDQELVELYGADGIGGYSGRSGRWQGPGRVANDVAVAELRGAVNDEAVADHPVAVASREFFDAIDEVTTTFQENNPTGNVAAGWETSVAGAPYRAFLVEMGDYLIDRTPEFAAVYDSVFEPIMAQGLDADDRAAEEAAGAS